MRDPQLEHEIEEIQELMSIWMHFYKILTEGFSPESITPEREGEFLQIKTTVAERHEDFMNIIETIKNQEDLYIGQNILALVKRTISLQGFTRLSAVEINKISIEWHDANIMLNEALGSLEYQRDELAKVSQLKHNLSQFKQSLLQGATGIVTSTKVRAVVGLVVLGAIGYVLYTNWGAIQESKFYKQYLEKVIAPILRIIPSP